MPRISLFRPHKSNDYRFLDMTISEMFTVGGVECHYHKYIGPKNPTAELASVDQPIYDVISETNIQDLLFLENRDRKYDPDIFQIRGIYRVEDLDFNLSQFGLFIENDTVFMTVHINDIIRTIGRKPIAGDVIEIPNLRDEFVMNTYDVALPRYFVISDVGRASEGFSVTWYPHLYRLRLNKFTDEAQFSDIMIAPTDPNANFLGDYNPITTYNPGDIVRFQGQLYTTTALSTGNAPTNTAFFTAYTGDLVKDVLSTADKMGTINDVIVQQAEADAPMSGYETRQFYTLSVTESDALLLAADMTTLDASYTWTDASLFLKTPLRSGYCGYLLGDGVPENGAPFGFGNSFPLTPSKDDFYLRTDYQPNRLFRFNGNRWVKHEDSVRHTLTNTDTRQTLKSSFINNTTVNNIDGRLVDERQDIKKALRPRADF